MAWKLKKSKADENGASESKASVVVSHGHSGPIAQPADEMDDFFLTRVSDAEDAVNGLHSAQETPFDDNDFMSEHPAPEPDDIPVIKSAFVTPAEPQDLETEHHLDLTEDEEPRPARAPIDFGDVDFNADQEHETLEFGTPSAGTEPVIPLAPTVPVQEVVPAIEAEDDNKTVITAAAPVAPPVESVDDDQTISMAAPAPVEPASVTDADKTISMGVPEVAAPPVELEPEPVAVAPTAPVAAPEAPKVLPTKVIVKLGPFSAEHDLTGAQTSISIGRPDYNTGETPDISVELDDAISRKHARIFQQDGQYKIEDLGSKNGTLINGQLLMPNVPMPFNVGDVVKVGERTELTLKA